MLALAGAEHRFATAAVDGLSTDPAAAGAALARACRGAAVPRPGSHATLLLLTGSMASDQQEIVRGVHRVLGSAVPIVGAAAAGVTVPVAETFVFHGGQAAADSAVGVWIESRTPLRVASGHGWQPIGPPMLATASRGRLLLELAGESADSVYHRACGVGAEAPIAERARAVFTHPLGLVQSDGSWVIRNVLDRELGGSVTTFAPVPTNAAVQVMGGSAEDLLAVCGPVVAETLAARAKPSVVLAFSCASRGAVLGPRIVEEAEAMQREAGDVPVFGFYTFGEFARTSSVLGFHNATLTALAL